MTKPDQLTIRAYQVGFGDCFLLSFRYPAKAPKKPASRHVLIDFGSTGLPDDVPDDMMDLIAADIAKTTGGKLTAVVATHRHKDHISGFTTTKKKDGTGDVIRALKPSLVMQPWTEDPAAKTDAHKATAAASGNHAFTASLAGMQQFAEASLREMERLDLGARSSLRRELAFIGDDNLKNLSAVENLMTMAKEQDGKQEYLCYGDKTKLQTLLPGVKVHVIGPPNVEQSEDVRKERSKDKDEFWHLMGASSATFRGGEKSPFDKSWALRGPPPPSARWIIPKMRRNRASQLLELVRILDDAMNNTSLILLFEAGGKKFLFPGDAQIENWSYALKTAPDHDAVCELLSQVDFYKVGHHGSLNATPKTLWGLFAKKNTKAAAGRLKTVVSTMAGKHGSTTADTEVPREPLVNALAANSDFFTTQSLKAAKTAKEKELVLFKDVVIPL